MIMISSLFFGRITVSFLSPESNLIASSSADKTVRLWNLQNQSSQELKILQGHNDAVE